MSRSLFRFLVMFPRPMPVPCSGVSFPYPVLANCPDILLYFSALLSSVHWPLTHISCVISHVYLTHTQPPVLVFPSLASNDSYKSHLFKHFQYIETGLTCPTCSMSLTSCHCSASRGPYSLCPHLILLLRLPHVGTLSLVPFLVPHAPCLIFCVLCTAFSFPYPKSRLSILFAQSILPSRLSRLSVLSRSSHLSYFLVF